MSPYFLILFCFTFLFDQCLSQPATLGITQQQPTSPIQSPATTIGPQQPAMISPVQSQAPGAAAGIVESPPPTQALPTVGQQPIQQQPATLAPIQSPQPTGAAGINVVSPRTQPKPTTTFSPTAALPPTQPLTTQSPAALPPLPPLATQQPASSPINQEAGFCKIQIKQKDGNLVWQTVEGTIVDQKCGGDQQDSSDELAPVGLGGTEAAAPGGFEAGEEGPESGSPSQVGPQQLAGSKLPAVTASNKRVDVGAKNSVESGAEEKMAAIGAVFVVALMARFGFLF